MFLWFTGSYRFISAQNDGRPYHYASISGPVAEDAEEIAVPRAVAPYPYKSTYEMENDMTFDYVAKPEYSFVYGVEDPDFGKSHKHQETRDGDVVKGEYSVLEPDGSLRRVIYTADAEKGFQATVITTPPKEGWTLPPQPSVNSDHLDVIAEHEEVTIPDDSSSFSPGDFSYNKPVEEPHEDEYHERIFEPLTFTPLKWHRGKKRHRYR